MDYAFFVNLFKTRNLSSLEWGDASLNEAINRFAPNVEPVITSKGKIIYNNQETGISVVYDKNGNYFRIEDTTRPRGRNYLDIKWK